VNALRRAAQGSSAAPLFFGRDGGEAVADGIGISSARDVPDLERIISLSREKKRMTAFHAGEKDRFDIDKAFPSNLISSFTARMPPGDSYGGVLTKGCDSSLRPFELDPGGDGFPKRPPLQR